MRIRPLSAILLASFIWVSFVSAAPDAPQSGMDEARLKAIPKVLQRFVDDGSVAGAVGLVARHGRIVSLEAVGYADLASKKPMRADNLFWIASMTKPITATAIMMQQDAGKLSVNDPVEKYLPEFKNQWMIAEKGKDTVSLRRAPRPITLRDLLTHTSGLSNIDAPRPDTSLAELAMGYAHEPLQFEPGSKWSYCNGGINTLGRIVEVTSGMSYAQFIQTRLLRPLGMKETTFWPTKAQTQRIATSYAPGENGKGLVPTSIYFIKGDLTSTSRTAFPAGGLFSKATDLVRFYQMILNGGSSDGRRYLSSAAVEQMTSTQTGDIKTGFVDGMTFGLGWGVVRQPQGVTAMLSPGTCGHGGAYGTQGWIDRKRDLILVLMIQRAKFPNGDASEIRGAIQQAAVDAIVK